MSIKKEPAIFIDDDGLHHVNVPLQKDKKPDHEMLEDEGATTVSQEHVDSPQRENYQLESASK